MGKAWCQTGRPDYAPQAVRALIVTNMYPTPERPALGVFVRDQVEALKHLPDVEIEVFAFEPGGYAGAAAELRRSRERFDVVHAHFGLTAWPALAARGHRRVLTLHGTDLANARSRAITLGALRLYDRVGAVSAELASTIPRWAVRREPAVLSCGVDTHRFHPIPRAQARSELGLDQDGRYVLFPADPARHEKRHDLARAVAGDVPLLTLTGIDPADVPLWVNAANAVLVPSDREGFGLAVLEALACDVPILATPVGIAPDALDAVAGTHCARFDLGAWQAALAPHLAQADPRVEGRARAEQFSAERMAARVLEAWRALG